MFPQHIIARKRDGHALTRDEIASFVTGATDGSWADYQLSALLMAIVWRGMTPQETAHYTEAMMHSGIVADLSRVRRPKSDKHSTGGVGDKVSLHLAPMVAACGVAVPMISGRGLGHTGGTPAFASIARSVSFARRCRKSVSRSSARPRSSRPRTRNSTRCAT
jgi:thymidine phosphorylase